MITPADALEVMTVIAACHHHSAPRIDDEQERRAAATVWAELFSGYDFTTAELVAAVKSRAKICPEAPEAADIIRVARAARCDRSARTELDSEQRLSYEAMCDSKTGYPVSGIDDPEGGKPIDPNDPEKLARRRAHQERMARIADKLQAEGDSEAADVLARLVDNPTRVKCPWCGAEPGKRCHVRGTEQLRFRRQIAHPARFDALKAAPPQTVDREAARDAGVSTFADIAARRMEGLER